MMLAIFSSSLGCGDSQFDCACYRRETGNLARQMTHNFPVQEREEHFARPPRETLYAAKRALFERNNSLLLFALCVVSLALGAVLFWTHGVYVASLERQPIYFGIDTQTGAIMALRPEALHVKITDEILRHHIEGFVAKHFSRLPVITAREYKGTLLMMDSALTGQGTEVAKDLKEIADLDDNPLAHDLVEVRAVNSTFEGTKGGCTRTESPAPQRFISRGPSPKRTCAPDVEHYEAQLLHSPEDQTRSGHDYVQPTRAGDHGNV